MYDNAFLQVYSILVFILGYAFGIWTTFLVMAFALKLSIKDLLKKIKNYEKELEKEIKDDKEE